MVQFVCFSKGSSSKELTLFRRADQCTRLLFSDPECKIIIGKRTTKMTPYEQNDNSSIDHHIEIIFVIGGIHAVSAEYFREGEKDIVASIKHETGNLKNTTNIKRKHITDNIRKYEFDIKDV
jgi:hypothetical protein